MTVSDCKMGFVQKLKSRAVLSSSASVLYCVELVSALLMDDLQGFIQADIECAVKLKCRWPCVLGDLGDMSCGKPFLGIG